MSEMVVVRYGYPDLKPIVIKLLELSLAIRHYTGESGVGTAEDIVKGDYADDKLAMIDGIAKRARELDDSILRALIEMSDK